MSGGSAPKRKGHGYEREVVKQATAAGLEAKRAWGSNGQAIGHHETVDLDVEGYRLQAKRRKRVAKWLVPTEHQDGVVFRADHGESLICVPLADWLDMLRRVT